MYQLGNTGDGVNNVIVPTGHMVDAVATRAADPALQADDLHDQALIAGQYNGPRIQQRQEIVIEICCSRWDRKAASADETCPVYVARVAITSDPADTVALGQGAYLIDNAIDAERRPPFADNINNNFLIIDQAKPNRRRHAHMKVKTQAVRRPASPPMILPSGRRHKAQSFANWAV
jgi:hypothetical protein